MIRTLLILFLVCYTFFISAQSCAQDGIVFSTQGEVDSFSINYPNCTEIVGSIKIMPDVFSLESLSEITLIRGNLIIEYNDALINLDGLENLNTIGENFHIRLNDSLTNIDSLHNLFSVGGNLYISNNDSLTNIGGLHNLSSVGGNLYVSHNDSLTNIDGLYNLTFIGGSLQIIGNNLITNINSLGNITSVSEDLFIRDNFLLTNINGLSGLTETTRHLGIYDNPSLTSLDGLSNLASVGGHLSVNNNDLLTSMTGLNNLISVNRDFHIQNNDLLTNLDGLGNLISVNGNFYLLNNDSLININALDNLSFMGEDLQIKYNDLLTNVNGFDNLISIGQDIRIEFNDRLTNLDGLNNITSINGGIIIKSNPLLVNLDGLSNITTFIDWLFIIDNPSLINLNGLSNITSINGTFNLTNNDLLTNLNGLSNLVSINENLILKENSQLSDCAIQAICQYLLIEEDADISGNSEGCNTWEEVEENCLGLTFSGNVYYDFNQNQQRDEFEAGISMQELQVEPQLDILFSNQNGDYFTICEENQFYTFALIDHPDWALTTDSTSYSTLFESNNPENENNNFGLYPTFIGHDYIINTSSNQVRCNTDVNFHIDICNEGTFLESEEETVVIKYSEFIDYVGATPTPITVDEINHTITFAYDTLYPWNCLTYVITFTIPGVEFIGEFIEVNTYAFRDSLGVSVLAGQQLYETEILCSYDPNDKLVIPQGEQDANYSLKDETFDYTIRFQNTGNIYAIDVTIKDTLDVDLDWNTFRVIQTSHSVQTTRSQDGIIFFYFKDINLPDSTSNPLGSQGFIRYAIDPIVGLPNYTVIENTAFIHFDLNPPIITNTTLNTLINEIPVNLKELNSTEKFRLYPNPTTGIVQIQIDETLNRDNFHWQILDATGKVLRSYCEVLNDKFDLSNYGNGLYTILIKEFNTGKLLMVKRILLLR